MESTTPITAAAQEYFESVRNPMSREQREAFLAQPHFTVMSIQREGRGPLSVPMWYGYEPGGDVWIITEKTSLKGKLLRPGVAVTFLMTSDFRTYVCVEGPVASLREPTMKDLLPLCYRYLDKEAAELYAKQIEATLSHSVLMSVRPERWSSNDLTRYVTTATAHIRRARPST